MYNILAEIPVPISAHFVADSTPKTSQKSAESTSRPSLVQLTSSIRDHTRNVKRTISKTIFVSPTNSPEEPHITSTPPQEVSDVVLSAVSYSGERKAVLKESGGKRYVEVWKHSTLEVSKEVTDVHGAFYGDDYLASLSFSHHENALVYTAEAKTPTDNTFDRFRFTPPLGEGFGTKKKPRVFVFRWGLSDTTNPTSLSALAPSTALLLGQTVFSPCNAKVLYATGYEHSPEGRLLGLKGCFNRPSGIWEVTLPPCAADDEELKCQLRKLTPSNLSCRSPRIFSAPSESSSATLIYIAQPTGGAHAATSTLHSLPISSEATADATNQKPVVEQVWDPESYDAFPGLYLDASLPAAPFVSLASSRKSTESFLITHSVWRSRSTVVLVSLSDGIVKDLTPADGDADNGKLYSWTVLGTDGGSRVICVRSSFGVPFEVVVGELSEDGQGEIGVRWTVIDKAQLDDTVGKALASLQVEIVQIPGRHPTETILIRPPNDTGSTLPCVTVPHGGPHGTSMTFFTPSITALALEGYTISLPNYTGSLGFGEKHVRALLGNAGVLDVNDCMESVKHLVHTGVAVEGKGQLFIQGGSHGGFLAGHLIGQFPDTFTAAVMRNPVISSGEISTSDIPDWYYAEFALDYPISSSPTTATSASQPDSKAPAVAPPLTMSTPVFDKLQRASPIFHVEKVRADVLLLIGGSDARVAPTQGVGYYHALRGAAINAGAKEGADQQERRVEMLLFDGEGHPIDGVEAARVGWECTRDWFAQSRG